MEILNLQSDKHKTTLELLLNVAESTIQVACQCADLTEQQRTQCEWSAYGNEYMNPGNCGGIKVFDRRD